MENNAKSTPYSLPCAWCESWSSIDGPCPYCGSNTSDDLFDSVRCSGCSGSGQVSQDTDSSIWPYTHLAVCPDCQGAGEICPPFAQYRREVLAEILEEILLWCRPFYEKR